MSAWVGFKRSIPFSTKNRASGTKWSLFKLFKLAINAITSFSSLPLQIVTIMGLIFLLGSLILGVQTLYMKLRGIAYSGFTTVILLLLVIGSALMISLGIIGTYIAKIYEEVKETAVSWRKGLSRIPERFLLAFPSICLFAFASYVCLFICQLAWLLACPRILIHVYLPATCLPVPSTQGRPFRAPLLISLQ